MKVNQLRRIKSTKKRAILMPEVLKIIIAALCIILLAYLAAKLYGIFQQNSSLQQATSELDAILGKANTLAGEETQQYLLIGPKDWRVIPYGDILCICPESNKAEEQRALCQSQGICRSFNKSIQLDGTFTTCILPAGYSGKGDDLPNCISLRQVPKNLYLNLDNGIIHISQEKKNQDLIGNFMDLSNPLNQDQNTANDVFTSYTFGTRSSDKGLVIDLSPFLQLKEGFKGSYGILKQNYYLFLRKDDTKDQINLYLNDASLEGTEYLVGKIDNSNWLWLANNFLTSFYSYSDNLKFFSTPQPEIYSQYCGLTSLKPADYCQVIKIYQSNLGIPYEQVKSTLEKMNLKQ